MIIGYDMLGEVIYSNKSIISNFNYLKGENAIYDELLVKNIVESYNVAREEFDVSTRLLALFNDNMEAGNIDNKGLELDSFAIKRRKITESDYITVGSVPYVDQETILFTDYTQARDNYVYTIVPIASNGLEGIGATTDEVKSEFCGWWLVDKDDNSYIKFDSFLGNSEPTVNIDLVQNANLINMFDQYPTITYGSLFYHKISLNSLFYTENLSDTNENTNTTYKSLISFIQKRKPFILKSGSGDLYAVDVSNIGKSSPLNTHKYRDYINVNLEFTEIKSEEDYHND